MSLCAYAYMPCGYDRRSWGWQDAGKEVGVARQQEEAERRKEG